jgi:hypothetical protein
MIPMTEKQINFFIVESGNDWENKTEEEILRIKIRTNLFTNIGLSFYDRKIKRV